MGIRKYKPTTPGLRGMTVSTFEEITTDKPEKSLTVTLKKHSGRNVRGKITARSPSDTEAAVTDLSTESSISREIRMISLQQ